MSRGLEASNIRMRGQLSIDRARQELGFRPRYDLAAGLEDYAAMFKRWLAPKAS